MKTYKIILNRIEQVPGLEIDLIETLVKKFCEYIKPYEEYVYLHLDQKTNAVYCECHILSAKMLKFGTIDVPLDPEEQPEYRANRDIVEDHVAFEQMKLDALEGRTFSNIVCEFDLENTPDFPLKIIGGQHRYLAIKGASVYGMEVYHSIKVYFNLNKDQRLDVQLISNINIAASPDLFDRLQETARGPELREWCQNVGFLDEGQDFSSQRQKGSALTVREVRSFIVNYFLGKEVDSKNFDNENTTPIICKTGRIDPDWERIRTEHKKLWTDVELKEAATEFIILDVQQRQSVEQSNSKINMKYAEKTLNYSILTSWAYVAGLLQKNKVRLKRHYDLKNTAKGRDPLNAEAMAKARHRTDPENYRGLATRNDAKERGRCVEMFFLQSEKGQGINPALLDVAIKRYHKKQANLEVLEAEKRI